MAFKNQSKVTRNLYGTNAERLAISTTDIDGKFVFFYETDTNSEYEWKGSEWVQTSINGAVPVTEMTVTAMTGGQSEAVSISTASAQSSAITAGSALVTPTVDCFFRQAANPTALSDGTDQILLGGNTYRVNAITSGNKLAFKTASGTGTVYITPGA